MKNVVAPKFLQPDIAMGYFGRITSLDDLPDRKTLVRYMNQAAKLNASGKPARNLRRARATLNTF